MKFFISRERGFRNVVPSLSRLACSSHYVRWSLSFSTTPAGTECAASERSARKDIQHEGSAPLSRWTALRSTLLPLTYIILYSFLPLHLPLGVGAGAERHSLLMCGCQLF